MILSVLRHTKSSVKFWFIENFLSPDFLVWFHINMLSWYTRMLTAPTGIPPPLRVRVWLPVRADHVQVAVLATRAEGEAAHHLGLQDPLPGRALPHGPEEGHLRRRRPDRPDGFEGARGVGPPWGAVRIHAYG